ncbi:hypothetical protein MGU_10658 [Metarhizium guizhouense ARSEF 977]|uniref:Uncharacterized protein n=1 Tax=Metarhizium guizhouense (strain ARSEF 977) TaxID=1276136 RepID=A0A0B4HR99_METGA|nr:hypothetical protein MGU_10658 [Metarhizium guizhouense ARSEF 977]
MSAPNEHVSLVTRSVMPVSQDETVAEGWRMRDESKSNKKGCSLKEGQQTDGTEATETILSPPPHQGYGIPSNEPAPAAPSGVMEVPSDKISTSENSEEAPAQLASGIHELDISSGQIYKPHTNASTDRGDLFPGQSSGPYPNTSTSPLGFWDTSKDVPASSVLESWTEEDRLKFGIHEGMDVNHGLPPFDENVCEYHTASSNRKSDDGIHDSSTHKPSASSVALGNRTESYGGINVTFGLPQWIETKFSETGETSEKNSNQHHLGAPFVQVSGLSPTPPRKDTDCKALRSVPLSAVGTPTATESYTPPVTKPAIQVQLVTGAQETRDKSGIKNSAAIWDTNADFDLNEGSRKMTEEDLARLDLQSWWKEDLSDVTTGLPLISKEDLPGLENVCEESLFSVGGPAAEDSGENVTERKTGIHRGRRRPPTANASSLLEMKVNPSIDFFGTTNQQGSPGHTLPSASTDWQPQRATQEPQPNDSVRAAIVTDSELADGSGWVKVEMETENPGQTGNV